MFTISAIDCSFWGDCKVTVNSKTSALSDTASHQVYSAMIAVRNYIMVNSISEQEKNGIHASVSCSDTGATSFYGAAAAAQCKGFIEIQ